MSRSGLVQDSEHIWTDWLRRSLILKPRKELFHDWVFKVLGFWIPHKSICADHCSILGYILDRNYTDISKTIAWSARGSGKSFITGLECWFNAIFNQKWEGVILGGSFDQAKKSYQATKLFWDITYDFGGIDLLETEPLISLTLLKNGSSYSIVPASPKAVRGPHPNALYIDEVDEVDPVIFSAAIQQPQTKNGYPAKWAILSTMHHIGGLMSELVDTAENRGFKLYKWCILEAMQACVDYSCSTCKLETYCHGNMKPVIEQEYKWQLQEDFIDPGEPPFMGFNTVEDVILKIQSASVTGEKSGLAIDVDAELFCKRPSRMGLVYSEFDPYVHVIEPFHISENWQRYRAIDFGYTNPYAIIYVARDPAKDIYYIYDEIYETGKSTRDLLPILTDGIRYELQVADVACPDDIADLNKAGLPFVGYKQTIADGLKRVRRLLKTRPDGKCGLYVFNNCKNTIREFQSYRYDDLRQSEIPIDENNHALSALRYLIYALERGYVLQKQGIYY